MGSLAFVYPFFLFLFYTPSAGFDTLGFDRESANSFFLSPLSGGALYTFCGFSNAQCISSFLCCVLLLGAKTSGSTQLAHLHLLCTLFSIFASVAAGHRT